MAEYLTKTEHLTAVADAIRAKGGTSDPLVYPDGFVSAIQAIPSGGGSATPVAPGDITFYDYDGTVVAAWSLAELAGKTALPELPSHAGLICQGWNWSLADLKATNRKMNVGAMYITDDGKTRIYIHLEEGRTSPMLGVCPNGTVTVDWGDGTTTDTLTGTSTGTVKWTPKHAYATPREYVITLDTNGSMSFYGDDSTNAGSGILRHSDDADARNRAYQNGVKRVEIGRGITLIGDGAFENCYSLASVTIPYEVTRLGSRMLNNCQSLRSVTIPNSVTSIYLRTFQYCYSLASVAIPNSVTGIYTNAFQYGSSLAAVTIPDSVTIIGAYALNSCYALTSCKIPGGVTSIDSYTFANCYGAAFYDFTDATAVPTLKAVYAFNSIPADCEIRVPAALVDEWKAATNWSTYADHIVGV